jgi:hypothetical protein
MEDALRDRFGHWYEYQLTFLSCLKNSGDSVRIFCSRDCTDAVQRALHAEPLLPKSIWARISDRSPKWKKLARIFTHGLSTWFAVVRLLQRESNKPDIIFVPTVLVHHLLGWFLVLLCYQGHARILLFFPNTPAFLDENGTPHWNPDPSAKLFALLIRLCRPWVQKDRLILGAETEAMVAAMSSLTGVTFRYLPHPVDSISLTSTRHSGRGSTICFGAYGAARYEKGSDLIQSAILLYLSDNPDPRVHFSFQWINDFALPNGRLASLDPRLLSHPQCDVINDLFPEGAYNAQIDATHVMLLPYRSAYRLRVSRVVIEAMQAGIPVIVTRGTTLCQQAGQYGVSIECDQNDPEQLVLAIRKAIDSIDQITSEACLAAPFSRNHFSVNNFRRLVLEGYHG